MIPKYEDVYDEVQNLSIGEEIEVEMNGLQCVDGSKFDCFQGIDKILRTTIIKRRYNDFNIMKLDNYKIKLFHQNQTKT